MSQSHGYVPTEIRNPKDIMIFTDIPHVTYIGKGKQGDIRPRLITGHDYGAFLRGQPRMVYNIEDLMWFLHPDRKNAFGVNIKRIEFPQYKYVELQNFDHYLTKALNLCITAGCEHVNPPPELSEDPDSEEMKLSEQRAMAEEEQRKRKNAAVYTPEPKRFEEMNVVQLKTICKSIGIGNFKNMKKAELVKSLTEYYGQDRMKL